MISLSKWQVYEKLKAELIMIDSASGLRLWIDQSQDAINFLPALLQQLLIMYAAPIIQKDREDKRK